MLPLQSGKQPQRQHQPKLHDRHSSDHAAIPPQAASPYQPVAVDLPPPATPHPITHQSHSWLPFFPIPNSFRSSSRPRINRVRTIPSGIPSSIATSREFRSSIALRTRTWRRSSGSASIIRRSCAACAFRTVFVSGDSPPPANCSSLRSRDRALLFGRRSSATLHTVRPGTPFRHSSAAKPHPDTT